MDQLNVKEQQEFQQIVEQKQMKDFMSLYSNLVSRCFDDCVNDFTSASLTNKESSCISKCSEKFLKHSERVGQRFQEQKSHVCVHVPHEYFQHESTTGVSDEEITMTILEVPKRDLGIIIVASVVNKTLKNYTGEFTDNKAVVSTSSFFHGLQSSANGYMSRYTKCEGKVFEITKEDLISIVTGSEFKPFFESVNDKIVVIRAKPREYEAALKKLVLESTMRYSESIIKQINFMGREYRSVKEMQKETQKRKTDELISERSEEKEVEKNEEDSEANDEIDENDDNNEKDEVVDEVTSEKEDQIDKVSQPPPVDIDEKIATKTESLDIEMGEIGAEDGLDGVEEVETTSGDLRSEKLPELEKNSTENIPAEDELAREIEEVNQEGIEDADVKPEEADGALNEQENGSEKEESVELEGNEASKAHETKEDEIGDEGDDEDDENEIREQEQSQDIDSTKQPSVERSLEPATEESESETPAQKTDPDFSRLFTRTTRSTPELPSRKRSRSPYTTTSSQHKRFQNIAVNLINSIQAHRYSSPFLQAVNKRDALEYYDVIYEPKNLKSILKTVKLKSEPPEYQLVKQLERDIMLMFANCIMYNKSDEDLVQLTISMKNDVNNIFKMFEEAELGIK